MKAQKPSDLDYAKIRIVDAHSGHVIEGEEAVKAYYKREEELLNTYGKMLYFQIYRMDMAADNMEDFQGPRLLEIKLAPHQITGEEKVATTKEKIREILIWQSEEPEKDFRLEEDDQITFFFNYRPMQDDLLFYADHMMLLPVWVQVLLHKCGTSELLQKLGSLSK